MYRRLPFFLCLAAILVACGAREPQYKLVKLPSGRSIKVLSMMKMYFTNDQPALMIKYETDLPIDNVTALGKEVDDIWQTFQADVERAHVNGAIISATTPSSGGFVSTNQSYNFVFQKSGDGSWHRLSNR